MKLQRHSAILRIIREQRISNQDALRRALAEQGIEVAQPTLSRDIRELRLVKQADPAGGGFYSVPTRQAAGPDLASLLPSLVREYEGVGILLVLRTVPGSADAVAGAITQAGWAEVIGTTVGPETVVLVTRSEAARQAVERKLDGLRD